MVTADDEDGNVCLVKKAKLVGKEPSRLHGCLVAVIEVAGKQKRVDPFFQANIYDLDERTPGGISDQLGQRGIT